MYMSERAPPNRMCPVSSGQRSVRATMQKITAAVSRGMGGSNAGDAEVAGCVRAGDLALVTLSSFVARALPRRRVHHGELTSGVRTCVVGSSAAVICTEPPRKLPSTLGLTPDIRVSSCVFGGAFHRCTTTQDQLAHCCLFYT